MSPVAERKAYIVTGPTSGIGYRTALELAKHGTVVLVGRDRDKLSYVQKKIAAKNHHSVAVVCDLADLESVKGAAAQIVALHLPIAGLLNNAGMMQMGPTTKNALGWDMTYATNHLGTFALAEALVPHLPDGANVVFVGSAVENPEHKPAVRFGFRGGRYISVEANARGEWQPGGSTQPGQDAYATSKQAILAAAMALSRETPRLHFNVVEPGLNPTTGLGGNTGAFVRFLQGTIIPLLVPLLMPFIKILSTPQRAARMITQVMLDASGRTGLYYDEGGKPLLGSTLSRDPQFQDRIVAETRSLLATVASADQQKKHRA